MDKMYKNSSDEPRQELPRVPWGFWLLFSPFLRPFSVLFITILVRLYYVVNNIGIKTIIHHTLKLYQLSENDSSMQNVVPFLILIPYTKFKNRYHSELVNRILSKTVLLLTDKAENSEHWAWNISKEGQKRSDIKTVSLLSQRNLSQREKNRKTDLFYV